MANKSDLRSMAEICKLQWCLSFAIVFLKLAIVVEEPRYDEKEHA